MFFPTEKVHAAAQCYQQNGFPIPLAAIGSQAQCISPNIWSDTPPPSTYETMGSPAPQLQTPESAPSSPACDGFFSCIWSLTTGGLAAMMGKIIAPIVSGLAWLLMKILSLFLMIAGLLLNFTLDVTVLQMADRIKNMTGINVAWKVIRDLMNIGFIFMLLYQGIKLIISQDSVESIRKFIIGIVLASLLINFSLFFTKIIIDSSNIATIGIYNTIIGDTGSTSTGLDRGLSNAFMNALGIQQFWSFDATNPLGGTEDDYSHMTTNIMACILIIVTTVVFLAISIMFIVRYITLVFLLALSPIAYMGMAFKGLEGPANRWWKTLWGQVIFAPLYMLMTWVTLTLIAGNFTTESATINLGSTTVAASANIFFNFAIIIGLTIASLFIAKDYSTQGASAVGKLSAGMMSFAGGAVFGGAGAMMRRTVGAGANSAANDEKLKERAANGSRMAQAQLAAYRYAGKSSFDARRSAVGGSIADATGVNFGKGTQGIPFMGNAKAGEGGYEKTLKDRAEAEKKYIESLKPDDATSDTYKENAKTEAARVLSSRERLKKYEDMDEDARREFFVQNPKELENYTQAKADVERMKELEALDEEKRKKYYEEHPEEEEEFVKKRKELADAAQAAKTAAEEAKAAIDAKVAESKATMERLAAELKTAETAAKFGLGTAEEAITLKNAQDAFNSETEKQKNLNKEIEQEKEALKNKVDVRQKAEQAITENTKTEKDKRMAILSDEHQALVFDSQEKGQSLYQKRGEAYASSIETRAIYNPKRLWRGAKSDSQPNKAAAAAVRKAVKEKKSTQKLEDILKDYAKENNKAEDKKEESPKPEGGAGEA